MNARTIVGPVVAFLLVVGAALACRQPQPNGDPKMPPNTPLPDVDPTNDEPKTDPTPATADAG